eukprot:26857-Eustigmatos_ZCMA.PRE.1
MAPSLLTSSIVVDFMQFTKYRSFDGCHFPVPNNRVVFSFFPPSSSSSTSALGRQQRYAHHHQETITIVLFTVVTISA